MFNFEELSNPSIVHLFDKCISVERRARAESIDLIREIDGRRIYIELGHTSLFCYLNNGKHLSPASAQRRIDAARLMNDVPELKGYLARGELGLTHISKLASGLRQTELTFINKAELIEEIRNQTVQATEKIVAERLNLKIKKRSSTRVQRDGSVRQELTYTKEQ